MKKSIVFLAFILVSLISFSQNNTVKEEEKVKISYFDASTGRSALGSGIYLTTGLTQGVNQSYQVIMTQDKILIQGFSKIAKTGLKIGPSLGYYKNVPFIGGIAIFSPLGQKVLSTFHWGGYSFGAPEGAMAIEPSFYS